MADRIIIAGVRRGESLISNFEIAQMAGRAGRYRDVAADVHIILEPTEFVSVQNIMDTPFIIESAMTNESAAFYFLQSKMNVSESNFGQWRARLLDQTTSWDGVHKVLWDSDAIGPDNELQMIGMASRAFRFWPTRLFAMKEAFSYGDDNGFHDDYILAAALSNALHPTGNWIPREAEPFADDLKSYAHDVPMTSLRTALALWGWIANTSIPKLGFQVRDVAKDLPNLSLAAAKINALYGWADKHAFAVRLQQLAKRIPSHLSEIVVPGMSKSLAQELFDLGKKTWEEVVQLQDVVDLVSQPEQLRRLIEKNDE